MDEFGKLFFFGFLGWWLYMATFRHKQLMELNGHMRGNVRDAGEGLTKGAVTGVRIWKMFRR